MKLGKNTSPYNISAEFKTGSCWVKNDHWVKLMNKLVNIPGVRLSTRIAQIVMKLDVNICANDIAIEFEIGL